MTNNIGREYLALSFYMDNLRKKVPQENDKESWFENCFCTWCTGQVTDYNEDL